MKHSSFKSVSIRFAAMQRCKVFGVLLTLYPTVETIASLMVWIEVWLMAEKGLVIPMVK
jgi:hypothetical protein